MHCRCVRGSRARLAARSRRRGVEILTRTQERLAAHCFTSIAAIQARHRLWRQCKLRLRLGEPLCQVVHLRLELSDDTASSILDVAIPRAKALRKLVDELKLVRGKSCAAGSFSL